MKRALGKPSHRSGSVAGVSTGATTLRPFTFSRVQLTGTHGLPEMRHYMFPKTDGVTEEEEDLSTKPSADLSHLGTIIVKAHRARPWATLPYIDKFRTSPTELPAVNEKSKKAASHCIRLELPSLPDTVTHRSSFHPTLALVSSGRRKFGLVPMGSNSSAKPPLPLSYSDTHPKASLLSQLPSTHHPRLPMGSNLISLRHTPSSGHNSQVSTVSDDEYLRPPVTPDE